MWRTGICCDNAAAESFFAALKNELVYRTAFPTPPKARAAIAEYIEVFYNRQRIHSSLGYRTPAQAETDYMAAQTAEARILVLVNDERTSKGLSALTLSSCADQTAESWAPIIQSNGAPSHQSLQPILNTCNVNTAGENVGYGNVTADQMMHRANIQYPSHASIGIAAVTDSSGRWYGVQDFVGGS